MVDLSLYILDIAINSLKAKSRNIDITLDYSSQDKITLVIEDDGIGMDIKKLDKVKRFESSNNSGFGLKRLNELVKKNEGNLQIHSSLNKGTKLVATMQSKNIELGNITDTLFCLFSYNESSNVSFKLISGEIEKEVSKQMLIDNKVDIRNHMIVKNQIELIFNKEKKYDFRTIKEN